MTVSDAEPARRLRIRLLPGAEPASRTSTRALMERAPSRAPRSASALLLPRQQLQHLDRFLDVPQPHGDPAAEGGDTLLHALEKLGPLVLRELADDLDLGLRQRVGTSDLPDDRSVNHSVPPPELRPAGRAV